MTLFTRWIVRHAWGVALISLLLAAVSAHFTVLLYKNLRTDFEELLPKSARSVRDIDQAKDKLASTTNLGVLVFSRHPDESRRFVDDLARAIEASRSPLVTRVEYKITEEIRFFSRRKALFADLKDLRKVRDYVRDRLQYEQDIRNPVNIFAETEIHEPKMQVRELGQGFSHRVESFTRFPDGYYATPDESVRVVLVYVSGKATGIENSLRLRRLVDSLIHDLKPRSYAPDLEIRYTGDVENLVEEHASLISDLETSAAIVTILVSLAMLLFYRDVIATAALVASLFVGVLATFAFAYFAVGYLNANTAFLGSIVIGNGINFGIIVLARYIEERRNHLEMPQALEVATSRTLKATLTAALAAGLSYGSLVLTSFRGFHQFGVIGLMGMVLCWLSAFVTMPAFLALAERWRLRRHANHRYAPTRRGFSLAVAAAVGRAPRLILAGSVALLVAAVIAGARYHGQLLETDMSRIRDDKSMTQGSGYYTVYMDRIFERYVSPLVILPPTHRETEEVARRLRERKAKEGPGSLIAGVYTIQDFVPKDQARKIRLLREIRQMLRPSVLRRLEPKDRKLAREFLTPEAFRGFGVRDLPQQIRDRFKENDGAIGRLVLVEPVFNETILNNALNQEIFIRTIRRIADSVHPGAPVVGQLPLTVDMYQSVRRDGPRATTVAFIAVVLLTIGIFRSARGSSLVLSGLMLGVVWLAGVIFRWELKINFLNFIALPITFGIGVDYAVNVIHRYQLEGRGSILQVIRSTGGAVALASCTTIIGYSSLLIAGNRGFVSFGRIAVVGEIVCLAAAILSLPAYLRIRDEQRDKKEASRLESRTREEEQRELRNAA